jgi:hypothetical protein
MGAIMRAYIFTERERAIVERFVNTGERSKGLKMIVYRVRNFSKLSADVDLYLRLRSRLAESKPAVST